MTEDYEFGLRIGALGLKTMFVRIPARAGRARECRQPRPFPGDDRPAVRQKARWLGGIALAGWDRLGWSGGLGERWMRMRDRRGPLAALLFLAAYSRPCCGRRSGWPKRWERRSTADRSDAGIAPHDQRLAARLAGSHAGGFTASAYGMEEACCRSRGLFVGNLIAMLAASRAFSLHRGGRTPRWDKTQHMFPKQAVQ